MATIDCVVVGDSGVIVAKTISYPVVVGNKIDDINAAKITAELKTLILANAGLTLAQLQAEQLAKQANVTALQSTVTSIPTNPLLATDSRLDNIAAIKAKTDPLVITGGLVSAIVDKTGYSLTSGEREAIATQVEAALLNEGDGQQLLEAIVTAIGNENITQTVLVAAIRDDIERAGGLLGNTFAVAAAGL